MSSTSDFVIENGVLKEYKGPGGDVIVPDGVTSIGDSAFSFCDSLTSIALPSSLISIGDDAFFDCGSLSSITIPESVVSIGKGAFYGCKGLADSNGFVIVNSILYHYCGPRVAQRHQPSVYHRLLQEERCH